MNYIYGKLQKQVEKVEYTAIDTDTAVVTINNVDRTIQVDINLKSEDPVAKQSYVKELVGAEAEERRDADDVLQKAIAEEIEARQDADDVLEQSKQDALVSGENIKTINGQNLLGEGDLDVKDVVVSDTQPANNAVLWVAPSESAQRSVLSALSWQEIAILSHAGKASQYFNIGDEKQITLSTGETVTMLILGFDHDDLSDGSGKAGITFGMKNALATKYYMNSRATNTGSWATSLMRTSTMNTLYRQLPVEIQNIIKTVNKITTTVYDSDSLGTTADKLFLLSMVEVMGTNMYDADTKYPSQYSIAGEGFQYAYYKNAITPKPASGSGEFVTASDIGAFYKQFGSDVNGYINKFGEDKNTSIAVYYNYNLAKAATDAGNAAIDWWLRSPYYEDDASFCAGMKAGYVAGTVASLSHYIAYAFCV